LTLGLTVLALCTAAVGLSAWRIHSLKRFRPPPPEVETIKTLTDRFERDMEEIFRNWR
jgi:hypothetical protein